MAKIYLAECLIYTLYELTMTTIFPAENFLLYNILFVIIAISYALSKFFLCVSRLEEDEVFYLSLKHLLGREGGSILDPSVATFTILDNDRMLNFFYSNPDWHAVMISMILFIIIRECGSMLPYPLNT